MTIKGRDAWVEQLSKRDMPVLAGIVKELNDLTGNDEADVNQLADVILKDANLTSQVLRIANSVHYNPSNYPINTVSRAIVLIGFNGVRAICISVMVIDSLLGKEPRERLLEQMACAFHAAVQARHLVRRTDSEVQEEVFIAALLYHLGEMAFWSCGKGAVEELEQLMAKDHVTVREATDQVLGCSFKSISKSLAENWNLGETLVQSLYPPSKPSPKVAAVILAQRLSEAAVNGWESPEAQEAIKQFARFTGLSLADTKKSILDAADEASSVALTYGAARVCHLIPGRRNTENLEFSDEGFQPMQADPQLQLNILRELSNALTENLDVNAIFQMVLEGLHRGVGLERVALCFIQNDEAHAKFVLGEGTGNWRDQFKFSVSKMDENIFTRAIRTKEPLWIDTKAGDAPKHLFSPEIKSVLGGECSALISGIFIGNRCIALFYADRWKLETQITKEQYQSFRHFMLQTQMSLQMLASKN
jgi:HD-like signal output (HDOD) protein